RRVARETGGDAPPGAADAADVDGGGRRRADAAGARRTGRGRHDRPGERGPVRLAGARRPGVRRPGRGAGPARARAPAGGGARAGGRGGPPRRKPHTPAALYLSADLAFQNAAAGRPEPSWFDVIERYERALREVPGFPDAPRALWVSGQLDLMLGLAPEAHA